MDMPKNMPTLNAEMVSMTNPLGKTCKYYMFSLLGLDCSTIHAVRKVRYSSSAGISHDQLLLQAARQFQENQAQSMYAFNSEEQLKTYPKALDEGQDNVLNLATMEGLQKKILQEAAKQGADLPDSQPDPSFDDDDGALQAKKVAPAQSSRLQGKVAVPKPKRRKSAKKPEQEQVEGEGEEVVEATSLSKELRAVADELKTVPRCFANLSPARTLAGEKLMRSVGAVPASTCSP